MNNSILSIALDKKMIYGWVWTMGLRTSKSTRQYLFSDSGVLGSVYSSSNHCNGYLMASNHGVFKYEDKQFSTVPSMQGQAWNISKINNRYLIGHNEDFRL
jgi:hypothetical protein